jgi:hypothetical protein
VNCQVDCQASGFASCKTRLQGGCEAECRSPEGAIFCDGNYVDHGGNAQRCIDALRTAVNVQVDVSARGSASGDCSGNTCKAQAEGEASASCAMARRASGSGAAGLLALAAGLGAAISRRRRRAA